MAEYIDKNATVGILEAMSRSTDCECIKKRLEKAAKRVSAIPAADVAPVVHGRWSDAGFGELPKHAPYGWACSVCGGISFNNEYIYCPNCGAKMDDERKDGGDG